MMKRIDARELIDAIIRLREGAGDALASLAVAAYPTLKCDGSLIPSGTRINYEGRILRAAVDLYDTEESSPTNAPVLWEEISYRAGCRIIPEVITTGTAFALEECGWWGDELYRSLFSNNVWTPEQLPDAWEKVNG